MSRLAGFPGVGRIPTAALLAALLLALGVAPLRAQAGEFLSEGEAVKEVFPDAARIAERVWSPSAAERSTLEEDLGRTLDASAYPVLLVYDGDRAFLGYALVTEERGKYSPITFMVGIDPRGQVEHTTVMVYRESRGGEVRSRRFLRQYQGKTLDDPIRANRDIVNISGATISVHSMNAGVRKALAIVAVAFPGGPPDVAAADLQTLEGGR